MSSNTTAPPLSGVRVLDLSTLLPGPLGTLMLAEAGADVIKIERPGRGDEMRSYHPKLGDASANYAVLNRGKRAFAADLKNPADRDRVLDLAAGADVVVEQFRPGVAARLGLGYGHVRSRNPGVVYCSITGYGQEGPHAGRAGHDLNYLAETGLLGVVTDASGTPQLPVSVLADIAAGSYPAVVNILLALRRRDLTGTGCHLDISMAHNLQVLAYGYFAAHQGGGGWPRPGAEQLTGGSPRYQIYATSDGRHLAVAALEQKFWERLAQLIDLPEHLVDDDGQEDAVIAAVAERIGAHPAGHWRKVFDGEDVCTAVVATFDEAVDSGLVEPDRPERLTGPGFDVGTLRSPLDPAVRAQPGRLGYPALPPLPPEVDPLWTSPGDRR
ncbi:CaiB/BaiF CoA-transferase family protein [Amycolatopsis endophytica]|uniref:Crotonobetainyl-CoA:carnitine CoA-transferase CaiB-like acyl-CoA transferase n=1 Tax=Amycolatopsis endophytica TaxID=860233 RepID=A0A853B8M8_9PSEU|nr:CaiB/BaiF CoA-transferase family protein [Amycolatopsis endophytica]NYI91114.1 crotonobetainyl-CoA:carnitine CoA-transferase CaiB-like acyl-CoA transferase [Amycolatopsis endophytica]